MKSTSCRKESQVALSAMELKHKNNLRWHFDNYIIFVKCKASRSSYYLFSYNFKTIPFPSLP